MPLRGRSYSTPINVPACPKPRHHHRIDLGRALWVRGHGNAGAMVHTVPFCTVFYVAHGGGPDPGGSFNFQTPNPCGYCGGYPYALRPACPFVTFCSGLRSSPIPSAAACRGAMPWGPEREKIILPGSGKRGSTRKGMLIEEHTLPCGCGADPRK